MAKLKAGLFSLDAAGTLAKTLTFLRRMKGQIVEKTPHPKDAKSAAQLAWRPMFQACADLWHTLSTAEKASWESAARPLHMTGYAYYMSQCLRPNPGIYLPLAGGTMQGDIDMDSHKILTLPDPTLDQDPVTLKYFNDNLPSGGYTQGCRLLNSTSQQIPDNEWIIITFDMELWDTDTMHDPALNPERITCHTPGKYLITARAIWSNAPGTLRILELYDQTDELCARDVQPSFAAFQTATKLITMRDMAENDYVYCAVIQDSGLILSLPTYDPAMVEFSAQRIG